MHPHNSVSYEDSGMLSMDASMTQHGTQIILITIVTIMMTLPKVAIDEINCSSCKKVMT